MRQEAERIARQGRSKSQLSFARDLASMCLWDYGEDELSERALSLSDDEWELVQRVAATYRDPDYPLPLTGQRVVNGHVVAFAVITVLEGLRPLARTRRRPARSRPPHLASVAEGGG